MLIRYGATETKNLIKMKKNSLANSANFGLALPTKVTGAKRGVGSFLTFYLEDQPVSGKEKDSFSDSNAFRIWIYLCNWKICRNRKVLLDSDELEDNKYEKCLGRLTGENLLSMKSGSNNDSFEFCFSGGTILKLSDASRVYGEGKEMFYVFENDNWIGSFSKAKGFYAD